MFGSFGSMGRYLAEKEAVKNLPQRKVTAAEFEAACIAAGSTPEEAKKQARISVAFGSGTWAHIGDEMLSIDSEANETK